MLRKALLPIFISIAVAASGQKSKYKGLPSIVWPKLYNITYRTQNVDGITIEKPVFTAEVKKLEGTKVTIPGYLVPFNNGSKSRQFMISSLPLNACFFCGVGGPETVAEVRTLKEVNYTEKPVEVRGILRLNDSDPDKMIYILENAEYLGEIDF